MKIHDEINSAIAAHGAWKDKLKTAIDTGVCESTPEKVKMDNNCSFGKWLHERIDPADKTSLHYTEVVEMHAKFHKEAGSILESALNGRKEEASDKMALGSDFAVYSGMLTRKMEQWKGSL
ncbi:MAG: CZB domain-containing protein [Sinobacterium sp.]|nr:CZB domain-containing protein [Sinobacterium sp.]